MAQSERQRIVVNSGKKKARKLSDKQIAIFGSPSQKAALRRRKAAKRAHSTKHKSATRRGPVKKNAGEIIGYTLATTAGNPGKKKGQRSMATTKKSKSTAAKKKASGYGTSKYKANTGKKKNTGGHSHHKKPRRKNSGAASRGGIGGIGALVTNAVFVIAGALGSKLLTQMVLGEKNTGFMGYAGNFAAGLGLWFLVDRGLKNHTAATGVASGTAVQIVLRLINDYTPFGQYVAQLGMGDYQAQAFVTPQVLVDPFNRAEIQIPGMWRQPMLPAAAGQPGAAAGSAGVGSYANGSVYGGKDSLY